MNSRTIGAVLLALGLNAAPLQAGAGAGTGAGTIVLSGEGTTNLNSEVPSLGVFRKRSFTFEITLDGSIPNTSGVDGEGSFAGAITSFVVDGVEVLSPQPIGNEVVYTLSNLIHELFIHVRDRERSVQLEGLLPNNHLGPEPLRLVGLEGLLRADFFGAPEIRVFVEGEPREFGSGVITSLSVQVTPSAGPVGCCLNVAVPSVMGAAHGGFDMRSAAAPVAVGQ